MFSIALTPEMLQNVDPTEADDTVGDESDTIQEISKH